MQSWHSTKINKYLALKTTTESLDDLWSFLQLKSVLGDTAVSLYCVVSKSYVSMILLSARTSKNLVSLSWNALFLSGWQEITKNELLLTSAFTRLSHLYWECHAHCIVVTNGGGMG